MQLEEMSAFFEKRLDGYEAHMMRNIAFADVFYPFTASCLPDTPQAAILDLGCGTGLELDFYFQKNPSAQVMGIDLSEGMLSALREKFPQKALNLICGSYFDEPFGENAFHAAVSVESLHHFTMEEKIPLYAKLYQALKKDGFFILTDYFALSEEEETRCREELAELKQAQGIRDQGFYHFDTPLTVAHEREALEKAGFANVRILKNWGATYTLKACKTLQEVRK